MYQWDLCCFKQWPWEWVFPWSALYKVTRFQQNIRDDSLIIVLHHSSLGRTSAPQSWIWRVGKVRCQSWKPVLAPEAELLHHGSGVHDWNNSWLKCHKEMPQNTKKEKPIQYFLIFQRSETGVTVLGRVVDLLLQRENQTAWGEKEYVWNKRDPSGHPLVLPLPVTKLNGKWQRPPSRQYY